MTSHEIAGEAFGLLGSGRQVQPYSDREPDFDLDRAYEVSALVRKMREDAGQVVVGRKIGFTNKTIWDEYAVHAPIWNYMFNRTVADLADDPVRLSDLSEPRLEPEIVFKLAAAPTLDMDDAELLASVEWIAHGFEIVQSLFPGWRFSAADTIAAYGLHGALRIGPKHHLGSTEARRPFDDLTRLDIALYRNGERVDTGSGENVLDGGPLAALRHLIGLLESQNHHPTLQAGEIITTGTLTRAFPIAPGETWSTRLTGTPLEGLTIRFA